MDKKTIGIDIGGTFIKIGVVNEEGSILKSVSIQTNVTEGPQQAVKRICTAIEKLIKELTFKYSDFIGIGIGIPGLLNTKEGLIISSPNLPGWEYYPLRNDIQLKLLGMPAFVENDANAAALGELYFGAGTDSNNLICLTLGTGVGGGVVVNGEIMHGENGVAGELGHITLFPNKGRICNCGNEGCLEAYVGSNGIVKSTLDIIEEYPESILNNYLKSPSVITPKLIFESAEDGDQLSSRILMEVGTYLGIAVSNFVNLFNPGIIVLSGGVANAYSYFYPQIKSELQKRAFDMPAKNVQIIKSRFGKEAGILGAASIVFSKGVSKANIFKSNRIQPENTKLLLGIHIGATGTRAAIITVQHNKVEIVKATSLVPQGNNMDEIIKVVKNQSIKIITDTGIKIEQLSGTGISTPGNIEVDLKTIVSSPNLEWANINIQGVFGKVLPNPIFIDNDGNAAALAELMFGKGRGVKNLLCITICTGIGAGLIINGEIYRGYRGLAGEVGHQTINPDGPYCVCGNRGCLEVYASGLAIVKTMKQLISTGRNTILIPEKDRLNYVDIISAAEKGDALAIEVLKEMGKYMGIGLANLINILGFEKLIITGRLSKGIRFFESELKLEIKNRVFPAAIHVASTIDISDMGEDSDLIASAATFLYQNSFNF